jgi:hypothetical protein
MKFSSTTWRCEQCGEQGTVEHDPRIDVWGAVQLIDEDHRRVSPDCKGGYRTSIRVVAEMERER